MSFETNQNDPSQSHFYVVVVTLPMIVGKCEITAGVEGFGTPLSCPFQDGTSTAINRNYSFATTNMPIVPVQTDDTNTPIYRNIIGIQEEGTELTSGEGLAIRGGGSITLADFIGDPNLDRAAARAVEKQGTFLSKWQARNVFEGKRIQIKKYRIPKTGMVDLSNDGESTFYVTRELRSDGRGNFVLTFVDELSKVEFDQAQFPANESGSLRSNIDNTLTAIPVDGVTDWLLKTLPFIVRVENELMLVIGVTNNQTSTASLTVNTRGQPITPFTQNVISATRNSSHSQGDEVFICEFADVRNIEKVLEDILLSAGVPSSVIPISDWATEIAIWHPNNKINTVFYESKDADEVLFSILQVFMLDMWYDPVVRQIKLKAISEWQKTSSTLTEGKEIDFESLRTRDVESLRYSRAFISYDKRFITDPDEAGSYAKGSFSVRTDLETDDSYGEPKLKRFKNSSLIDKAGADLLCIRYVQRYGLMPRRYSWITQERFRTFGVGDVVNIVSPCLQGFDGLPAVGLRAQIIKIQPIFGRIGREYRVDALTYQPAATAGGVTATFTLTSGVEVNLFTQAGAPPDAVSVIFILDGGRFSSSSVSIPSIRAGEFATGSSIVIILRNGSDIGSKGGRGGAGGSASNVSTEEFSNPGFAGENAGIVYDAQGIDTNIHLSGTDPLNGVADGLLRAPGGGDGGFDSPSINQAGDGGNGGKGLDFGLGGSAGEAEGTADNGVDGISNSTPLGTNGATNTGNIGGLAGKGIVKNGATVRVFGGTALNFINGIGDAPDP